MARRRGRSPGLSDGMTGLLLGLAGVVLIGALGGGYWFVKSSRPLWIQRPTAQNLVRVAYMQSCSIVAIPFLSNKPRGYAKLSKNLRMTRSLDCASTCIHFKATHNTPFSPS